MLFETLQFPRGNHYSYKDIKYLSGAFILNIKTYSTLLASDKRWIIDAFAALSPMYKYIRFVTDLVFLAY